ncbi:MAG: RRXRR domain-containing protein, partial [Alistipes sp.]|nr:RRXRR domain-containing protein [Candidatus Alistipes equi]MBQ0081443.1 RRXRR domain-containing protein [Candidatus Alistipes equi]
MVYVISKSGNPLMPTRKHAMVRRFLKRGRAH